MENLKALSKVLVAPVHGLPPINSRSFLLQIYPEFESKSALFTWSHPVGGVGSKLREVYGNNEALVRIQLHSEVRVLTLNASFYYVDLVAGKPWLGSDHRYIRDPLPENLNQYDLILYTYSQQDNAAGAQKRRLYQEWIILNPAVIESVTADPDVLVPVVTAELTKLKDPNFKYPPRYIHSVWGTPSSSLFDGNSNPKLNGRQQTIERLEAYVATPRHAYPAAMLLHAKPAANKRICEGLF